MEPLVDMRVSRVAPTVEGNLVELVDLVKQMGRTGDLTESQNRKMVGYLGNLDDMRGQIVIMVQRYEDDSKVLKRLLDLIDRIDDVKQLAVTSQSSEGGNCSLESDKEIAQHYDTPFNPLMVSTINILDVSGLFADKIEDKVIEEEEEEVGDEYWDHEDDLASLAEAAEDLPKDISSINLSVSNLNLPNLFRETPEPIPQSSTDNLSDKEKDIRKAKDKKGKKAVPEVEKVEIGKAKAKAKGKQKIVEKESKNKKPIRAKGKHSESASSSESSSEGESTGTVIGKGKAIAISGSESDSGSESESESSYSGSSDEANGASSAKPVIGVRGRWKSATITGSSSSSSASSSSSSIPPPPPPPPPSKYVKHPRKLKEKRVGPCDPVLCKICYDEYSRLEQLYEFKPCAHKYCIDCLQDYLTTHINEGAVLDLVCPFPDCESEILPNDVKFLCIPETFAKFERFTVLAALRADPNARWCPNPYCNNGIKADPSKPWVYCGACRFEFCFHCMAERHDGAACGKEALEYLQKKRESEAAALKEFTEWTGANQARVKPCPTCKTFIEKNDGCNHMTCGNPTCKTQFCWLCLNLYNADHFSSADYPDCYDKQYWNPDPPNLYVPQYPPVPPRTRRFANIAKKVGMYMGVGVAVVTLGVPAAVIGGPVYGCFQLHKRLKARRHHRRRTSYRDDDFVPPSPARIAEAAREAARLRALEAQLWR